LGWISDEEVDQRAATGDLALAVDAATGILVDVETELVGRHVQAGLFRIE
jgi:hypothetical protein